MTRVGGEDVSVSKEQAKEKNIGGGGNGIKI